MALEKKSVLLYCDLIHTVEKLDNNTAGELFKHYLRYVNDLNPETENPIVDIVFEPIKQQLKRDLKKWDSIREKRSEAGKKSAEKRKQKQQVSTSVESVKQASTNPTVKVTDTVTVNVTDNVNVKVTDINKEKTKVFSEEVLTCYDELVILFPESTRPKDQKTKNDWCDVIDKLNRIDKIPFEIIKKITAAARNDDFWGKHFLTLPKLRKKNRDKTPYVTVFFERFKSDINPERKIDRQTESVMRKNMDIGSWLTEKEKADLTPEQRLEYGIN